VLRQSTRKTVEHKRQETVLSQSDRKTFEHKSGSRQQNTVLRQSAKEKSRRQEWEQTAEDIVEIECHRKQ
jgi:hypothetical protein